MRLFRRRPAPAPVPLDLAAVLDELAEAYTAHSGYVAALLIGHAANRLAVDALVIDPQSEPWEIAMATAEADGSREALLTYCTTLEETHR